MIHLICIKPPIVVISPKIAESNEDLPLPTCPITMVSLPKECGNDDELRQVSTILYNQSAVHFIVSFSTLLCRFGIVSCRLYVEPIHGHVFYVSQCCDSLLVCLFVCLFVRFFVCP